MIGIGEENAPIQSIAAFFKGIWRRGRDVNLAHNSLLPYFSNPIKTFTAKDFSCYITDYANVVINC